MVGYYSKCPGNLGKRSFSLIFVTQMQEPGLVAPKCVERFPWTQAFQRVVYRPMRPREPTAGGQSAHETPGIPPEHRRAVRHRTGQLKKTRPCRQCAFFVLYVARNVFFLRASAQFVIPLYRNLSLHWIHCNVN
eukprot:gene13451-biopygen15586